MEYSILKEFPKTWFAGEEEFEAVLGNIKEITSNPNYIIEYEEFDDYQCIRKVKLNLIFAEFL